jgi:hypothetical protein
MPWQNLQQAFGNTPAAFMTQLTPPPVHTAPNSRSWQPALPAPRVQVIAPAITSEIALRGDHRNPQAVDQANGLWYHQFLNPPLPPAGAQVNYPPGTWLGTHRGPAAGGPTGGVFEYPAARYNPNTHQAGPGQAPYVSCTRHVGVAKGFAGPTGFVYLVRVNVGVDYNQFAGGNALQAEVMALQGIALRDIIAVRRLADNQVLLNLGFRQDNMTPAEFNTGIVLLSG